MRFQMPNLHYFDRYWIRLIVVFATLEYSAAETTPNYII